MIRKTMRIGEVRTSIKLETEFWSYLKEVAEARGIRLSTLINEVAEATPGRTNLASTLRTFSLAHARTRSVSLRSELERLSLAGNSNDLVRLLEASPLPSLLLDAERQIKQVNRSFALWLNLDPKATLGKRLDNVMILRGPNIKEMWASLLEGRLGRASFNATYVSPGRVRTSQAIAIALGCGQNDVQRRGYAVMFETLAGRN